MNPSYIYPLNFKHIKTNYITTTYCHNLYLKKYIYIKTVVKLLY